MMSAMSYTKRRKMSSIESCKYSNVILSTQELKFTVQEGCPLPLEQVIGLERAIPTDLSPTWEAFSRARWFSYEPKFCHKYNAVPNQIQVNITENMAVGKYQDTITLSASNGVAILPSPVVSIVLEVQPKPLPVKPLKIITADLPDGELSKLYACQVEAEGGVEPYNWLCPSLPEGLLINNQAKIYGVPTVSGTFPVTIYVQDSSQNSYKMEYILTITEPPARVAITQPIGGETWYIGETHNIAWVAEYPGDEELVIDLFCNGAWLLVATTPANSLKFSWLVNFGVGIDDIIRLTLPSGVSVQSGPVEIKEHSGCLPLPIAKVVNMIRRLI
jgi:hypothetical protein